ncbi:MAG: hypothetical protein ABJA78_08355, partial [Ferruginibacter sp.]
MKKILLLIIVTLSVKSIVAQTGSYTDEIKIYQNKYVNSHEVVKGKDRKLIGFYQVSPDYKVAARFEKSKDSTTVAMKTSGTKIPIKNFVRYGKIYFMFRISYYYMFVF